MTQPHALQPKKGSRRAPHVVGRGHGSGWGTTAGRGTKGQRARTGGRRGLKLFGLKASLQSIPKLRGFHSQAKKPVTITLTQLQRRGDGDTMITPAQLAAWGLIRTERTAVKIVGNVLEKKLSVSGIPVSAGARKAIEAAGGSVA